MSVSECSSIRYFFEVDLKYPDELHEWHNDYLFASEKLAVSIDMLSKYWGKIADKYQTKVGDVKKINSKFG